MRSRPAPVLAAALLVASLGGCGGDPEPLPASVPTVPERCALVSDDLADNLFQVWLLETDDGLLAAWVELPEDAPGTVEATLATASIAGDGTAGPVSYSVLTRQRIDDIASPQLIAPVGDKLLVVLGAFQAVVSISNTREINPIQLPLRRGLTGLALDASRIALFGGSRSDLLWFQVLDVTTGELTVDVTFPNVWSDHGAAPGVPGYLGQAYRLLRLTSGELLALWIGIDGSAWGMVMDESGEVSFGPREVALPLAGKSIFVPRAAELPSGELALVWTGISGTEVRAAAVPADLGATEVSTGRIVNAAKEGSQEYADVFMQGADPRVTWITEESGMSTRSLRVTGEVAEPFEVESDPVDGCSRIVEGAPAIAMGPDGPVALWLDRGWRGPRHLLAKPVLP